MEQQPPNKKKPPNKVVVHPRSLAFVNSTKVSWESLHSKFFMLWYENNPLATKTLKNQTNISQNKKNNPNKHYYFPMFLHSNCLPCIFIKNNFWTSILQHVLKETNKLVCIESH